MRSSTVFVYRFVGAKWYLPHFENWFQYLGAVFLFLQPHVDGVQTRALR